MQTISRPFMPTRNVLDSVPICRLAGYPVAALDNAQTIVLCQDILNSGQPCWMVTLNLEMVSRGKLDFSYRELILKSDLFIADGMPLVWGSKMKRGVPSIPERAAGADLTVELIRLVSSDKIAIIGGKDPIQALQKIGLKNPEAAYIFNGKVEATAEAADEFAAEIKRRGSQLVFVALGVPKQDRIAALLRERLDQGLLVGVGGTFELMAGQLKRAPAWMRKSGFEWLFRLLQEPKRLAHRYLVVYWVGGFALAGDIVKSWFRGGKD